MRRLRKDDTGKETVMEEKELTPWVKAEGVYVASRTQMLLAKAKLPHKLKFATKDFLKRESGFSDKKFEETWDKLKKEGTVREVLVKYDSRGMIADLYDEKRPGITRTEK